jgi:hypothetical protein
MGSWLRVAIGSLELLGAIGLLIPLFAGLAAACLAALMVGATGTGLFVVDAGSITAPLICFTVVSVVVVLRRRSARSFQRWRCSTRLYLSGRTDRLARV